MKTAFNISVVALLKVTLVASLGMAIPLVLETKKSLPSKPEHAKTVPAEDQFAPVDDMHPFLEYVCEPSYKGLKQLLATKPENRTAWKAFKYHAIVLAETSALVANRAAEDSDKAKQWRQIALPVHKSGTAFYKSAGKYDEAKKHYGLLVEQCNKCHTVLADGKHQLKK